jgi:hypothetical protein
MADNLAKTNSPGAGEDWYGYVNATGPARLAPVLHAKQLKLARELVPAAALIGVLINPDSPKAELLLSDVQTAARAIGQPIHILNASSEGDLENVFATIVAQHVGALVVTSDAMFNSQFDRIVALAGRHRVPTLYATGAGMGLEIEGSGVVERLGIDCVHPAEEFANSVISRRERDRH